MDWSYDKLRFRVTFNEDTDDEYVLNLNNLRFNCSALSQKWVILCIERLMDPKYVVSSATAIQHKTLLDLRGTNPWDKS